MGASRRGLLSWGDVEHLVLRGHSERPVRAHPDPCLGDSSRGSWSPQPLAQAQAMRQYHSDALPGLTPNLPGDSHRKISPTPRFLHACGAPGNARDSADSDRAPCRQQQPNHAVTREAQARITSLKYNYLCDSLASENSNLLLAYSCNNQA